MVEKILCQGFSTFNRIYISFLAWLLRPFVLFLGKGVFGVFHGLMVTVVTLFAMTLNIEVKNPFGWEICASLLVLAAFSWVNMFYVWIAMDRIKD